MGKLNYDPTRDCYKKTRKGKPYYVGQGRLPDESEEYREKRAIAEWLQIERGLREHSSTTFHADPFHSSAHDYSLDPDLPAIIRLPCGEVTVDELVGILLQSIRQLAESGARAISTYREAKDSLADFQAFCKRYGKTLISEVDAHFVLAYKNKQHELMHNRVYSAYVVQRRLRYVVRLMEWGYENEFVDVLPRNINKNLYQVDLPEPTPHPFTNQQVQQLWMTAKTKSKCSRKGYRNCLYILLGLNLGYRAGDIASLRHEDIDWTSYVVHRKRAKTNAAQIHKLWPLTAKLLAEEMTDPTEHELVLLDERGGLLVVESLDAKTAKTDCIGRCFNRLKTKLDWRGPHMGHSCLRDTSAQALKDNGFPREIIKQFLGHKERDVVRHYVTESVASRKDLFTAIDWLEGYFGLS
jgi:integrase